MWYQFVGLLACFFSSLTIAVCALAYAGLLVPSEGVVAFTGALGDALTGDFDGMRSQWSAFNEVLDSDPLLAPTLSYKVFASITVFLVIVHLGRWGIRKHILRLTEDKAEGGQKQARALLKSAQKKIIDVGFAQLEETLDSVIKGAVRDAINADPWAPRGLAKVFDKVWNSLWPDIIDTIHENYLLTKLAPAEADVKELTDPRVWPVT